jgi:hypothetical protein
MESYFIELPKLHVDKQKLIDIKNQHTDKIQFWEHNGEPEGYSEIYWSFKEGKDIFFEMFPFECRGYQFVILPKDYRIGIHKDVKIGARLGMLLEGSGSINFYSERSDEAFVCSTDYKNPALLDPLQFHDVINKDEERVTFFLTFTESYEEVKKRFITYSASV